jgi:hypothetical protein
MSTVTAFEPTENGESLARERISRLVYERDQLRQGGSDRDHLERNRLEIVTAQHDLSYVLIARYKPTLS